MRKPELARGTLRLNPRGFGFVVPEDRIAYPEDIFIPKQLVGNAVDGDIVLVSINPEQRQGKGPDGRIEEIVTRGRKTVAGIISHADATITAYVPLLGEERAAIVEKKRGQKIQLGDRVILFVKEWGDRKTPTICTIEKTIGPITDPSIDITAAIEEFDLPRKFPEEVIAQARSYGDTVLPQEKKGRLDLTKAVSFTIDPETAKDYDDAVSLKKDERGHYYLGVHIADVAHYIKPGTPLDVEAKLRGNSTYFPGRCIPMIPEELSNHLCSLKEGEVRLTVSVLAEFDKEGTVVQAKVVRSFIKSRKRFTYGQALEILEGKKKSRYAEPLAQMQELCFLLKKKRSERGSIDFSLPELILELDEQGMPRGVKIEEYHITHQMVEEFMLKANELVAIHLSNRGINPLYRTHEEPSPDNMEEFFSLARTFGFQLPPKPTQQDIQTMFEEAKKTSYGQQLAIEFIRNLKLATYSPNNIGHFGLALEHYCHFTSPIRRYSDLVTERLLFSEEEKGLNLQDIGRHCSERERLSFRSEMSVKKLKKHRLLQHWQESDPKTIYNAFVTKIKPFGFFFEIKELFLEGFLHISEIGSDYYIYDAEVPIIYGRGSREEFRVGTPLTLRPTQINLIHQEVKWERVTNSKKRKQ